MEIELEIKLLTLYDDKILNELYKIHCQKLGEGYLNKKHLIEEIEKKHIIIAIDKNEVVGYLKFANCTEKEFFKMENLLVPNSNQKILALYTMAVKYEKKGIGTQTVKFCLDNFLADANKIYCPVWTSKNGTNAHQLLTNFGLKKIKSYKNFWYKDSLGVKNFCPICNTPCYCTLDIYCKTLS